MQILFLFAFGVPSFGLTSIEMIDFYNPDRYPFWIYKSAVLVAGSPETKIGYSINDSAAWVLERLDIAYNSIGDQDPTDFSRVNIQILDPCRSQKRFNVPAPVTLVSSPGIYDQFPVARPGNSQVFYSMPINRLFLKSSAFEISFSNFINTTGDINIDVLAIGTRMLDRALNKV